MTHRTLGAMLWTLSGNTVQNILKLVMMVVLARLLRPADFGLVSVAMLVANFASFLSMVGVGPAIIQRSDLEARHIRTAFTFSAISGALLFVVLTVIAPVISSFFRMADLTPILYALAVAFPLANMSVVAESLLVRELKFRLIAIRQVVAYFIGYTVVGVPLAALGFGPWALVAATIVQTATNTILLLILQPHPKRPLLDFAALRDLLHYGGGMTLGRICNYFAVRIDNLVVGRWLGADALGIYGRAYALMTTSTTLFGRALDVVLFPAMSRIQHDKERLHATYRRGIALITLAFLPPSGVLLLLAPETVAVLLGPGWEGVVVPFQVLAIGMLLRPNYRMSENVARAMGLVYQSAWRQAVFALLVFAGALIGQRWGLPGVAVGVLLALAINVLLSTQLTLGLLSMRWRDFFRAQRPGASVSLIAWGETWVAASLLRDFGAPPAVTLLLAFFLVCATLFLLLLVTPQIVLGPEGRWILKSLAPYVPRRPGFLLQFHSRVEARLRPAG